MKTEEPRKLNPNPQLDVLPRPTIGKWMVTITCSVLLSGIAIAIVVTIQWVLWDLYRYLLDNMQLPSLSWGRIHNRLNLGMITATIIGAPFLIIGNIILQIWWNFWQTKSIATWIIYLIVPEIIASFMFKFLFFESYFGVPVSGSVATIVAVLTVLKILLWTQKSRIKLCNEHEVTNMAKGQMRHQ